MTTSRISALAVALLLPLVVVCGSEEVAAPTASEPTSAAVALVAPTTSSATATPEAEEREFEIVTLLPFDAIPAVLEPEFVGAGEADGKLAELLEGRSRRDADAALMAGGDDPDDALVLGVSVNGDSRAYYIPTLSRVEIVNDTVGGQPLAVTW